MPAPRFFSPQPLEVGSQVVLDHAVYVHAIQVLRLRQGAAIVLFNDTGGEYYALIERIEKKAAYARINTFCADERGAVLQITLVQAISKSTPMDYAVQKATELGVCNIIPVFSERSAIRGHDERMAKRLEHWRRIVASACEQCGRNRLPKLHEPLALRDWFDQGQKEGIILDPEALAGLGSVMDRPHSLCVVVGAEGGFSGEELRLAECAGLARIRMGMRIMRTETAVVTALAAVHALWGDFT